MGSYVSAREDEGGGVRGGGGSRAIIRHCSVILVCENGILLIRVRFTPL